MRVIATAIAYFLSLTVVAYVMLIVMVIVAGPHAGLLQSWLEQVVIVLGWVVIFVIPIPVARKVWRRFGRSGFTS